MMKRWIIHIHSVAKENNQNFAGEVHEYYYGSGYKLLHRIDQHHLSVSDIYPYFIHEYGYKTKAAAVKGLNAHSAYIEEFWTDTFEIIEVEV